VDMSMCQTGDPDAQGLALPFRLCVRKCLADDEHDYQEELHNVFF